jgi:hypothetical protein
VPIQSYIQQLVVTVSSDYSSVAIVNSWRLIPEACLDKFELVDQGTSRISSSFQPSLKFGANPLSL